MIKKACLLALMVITISACSQNKYKLLLTGASFASDENGWFEVGCRQLNATSVNRAVGAEAIADAANKMAKGELYTKAELEEIDAFVIMHVHDKDVVEDSEIKENIEDYKIPFDRSNYAAAYDYVIKKYLTDCYNLKFDKNSKYYNTITGKPAIIVLSTHWHDSRPLYNRTVRELAEKWGFPVIEFDRYIGFSKKALHPVTKQQTSIIFTDNNTEDIDGEVFGWHQFRGESQYIQRKMAAVFVEEMKKVLPVKE